MASTLATTSAEKLDRQFALLRETRRKALVCYVTAGHPSREHSLELLAGLEEAGADVIEVGVPFSDPIADGPVIQASSQKALAAGMTLDGVLDLVSRASLKIPVVLFSYLNPVMAGGSDILVRCREAGVDGVLITDLPVGADPEREAWIGESGLSFVRLVAPTTPEDRMREIARNGSGFVYLISRLGVTGVSADIPPELPACAAMLKRVTDLPVCIGFGVTDAAQARAVAAIADGVVVGSAIVRAAEHDVAEAVALTRSMRLALDSSG